MTAEKFLVIGQNAVLGEEKIPADQKGRSNVLYRGQRLRLYEWHGVYYVVQHYLDPDHMERVLGPYVAKKSIA